MLGPEFSAFHYRCLVLTSNLHGIHMYVAEFAGLAQRRIPVKFVLTGHPSSGIRSKLPDRGKSERKW